ncbi:VP7 [California hare coltivirus]|nr:VP7 [California hare coltivirus]
MATSKWGTVIPKTSSFDYIQVKLQTTAQTNTKNLIIAFPAVSYFYGVTWTTSDLIMVRFPRDAVPSGNFERSTNIYQLTWQVIDDCIHCTMASGLTDRILLTCNIGTMYFTATFLVSDITETAKTVYGMFNYVSLSNVMVVVTGTDAAHVEALIAVERNVIRHRIDKLVLWSLYNTGTHLKFGRLITKVGRDPETGYYKGVTKTKEEIKKYNIPQGESWYYVELWPTSHLDIEGAGSAFFLRIRGVGIRAERMVTAWKAQEIFKPPTARLESDFPYSIYPEGQEDDNLATHRARLLAQSIIKDLGHKTLDELDEAEESHPPIGSADCIAALLDLLYRRTEEVAVALNQEYKPRRRRAAVAPQVVDPAVPSIQTYQNVIRGMLSEVSNCKREVTSVREKFQLLEAKIAQYVTPEALAKVTKIESRIEQIEGHRERVTSLSKELDALKKTYVILNQALQDETQQGSDFAADLENVRAELQGAELGVKSRLGKNIVTVFKPMVKALAQQIDACMKIGSMDSLQNKVVHLTDRLEALSREVVALQNKERPRLFYLHDKSEIKAASGALNAIASHIYLGWVGQEFICPSVLGTVYHHDRFIQGVYYRLSACTVEMTHFDQGTMILLIRDHVPETGLLHDISSEIVLDQCDYLPGITLLSRDRVSPVDYIEVYEVVQPGVFTISFSHLIAIYIPRCPGLRLLP